MRFTRREFLRTGGRSLIAASALSQFGCARDNSAAQLEQRIPDLMKKLHVPGVSLAVIRDARISWSRGFGVRDNATSMPVDDDTVFSAQSMSKPVFAYRVMKLAEQGVLEMMQPKPADDYRLNAASHADMLKPVIDVPGPVKMSWALGWQVWHLEPGDMIAHGGDDDGWHCMSGFSPVRKTGFVIMTNGEGGAPMIFNELLKTLAGKILFP